MSPNFMSEMVMCWIGLHDISTYSPEADHVKNYISIYSNTGAAIIYFLLSARKINYLFIYKRKAKYSTLKYAGLLVPYKLANDSYQNDTLAIFYAKLYGKNYLFVSNENNLYFLGTDKIKISSLLTIGILINLLVSK